MTEEEIEAFLKALKEDVPTVKKVSFPELKEVSPAPEIKVSLKHLYDVEVTITAVLGNAILKGRKVLELKEGTLIILDKVVGEQVDLYINDQKFARGEVLVIGDAFAIRISSIYPPPENAL